MGKKRIVYPHPMKAKDFPTKPAARASDFVELPAVRLCLTASLKLMFKIAVRTYYSLHGAVIVQAKLAHCRTLTGGVNEMGNYAT